MGVQWNSINRGLCVISFSSAGLGRMSLGGELLFDALLVWILNTIINAIVNNKTALLRISLSIKLFQSENICRSNRSSRQSLIL